MTGVSSPARDNNVELVEKQDQICSFRAAIERGALGTVRGAYEIHKHALEPFWQCRRLWLAVLEQCAAEAQGERMWDVADRKQQSRLQRDAAAFLATLGPELIELGARIGLDAEQTRRLTMLRPSELLRNLTVWAEQEQREQDVEAARVKKLGGK